MAIRAEIIKQVCSYIPVADELQKTLDLIQDDWKCKVISVFETIINKSPDCDVQGFIIIYDDKKGEQKMKLKPCPCGNENVYLERKPLWNGRRGYVGCYKYEVVCDNPKCI